MVVVSSGGFVGRADELAVFEAAIEAARHDVPSVLLVGGDAGIGKSTLVAEASDRAGASLFVGRCVPVGARGLALAPLVHLVRQVERSSQRHVLDEPALAALARAMPIGGEDAGSTGELFVAAVELVGALGTADVRSAAITGAWPPPRPPTPTWRSDAGPTPPRQPTERPRSTPAPLLPAGRR